MSRKISGFWWTWVEGHDWPSWYYGEAAARDALKRLAFSHVGRPIRIGTLEVVEKVTLPDKLTVER